MDYWDDLERRVRERGVRVRERLDLLRALREGREGLEALARRRQDLLAEVRRAAEALLGEAGGR